MPCPGQLKRTLSQSLSERKSKRKKDREGNELEPYRSLAKWIARTESPFTVFGCVFQDGFVADAHQERDEVEDHDDILEREQNIRIYRMITRKIPTFEARIPAFIENPEQLNDLSSVMNAAAGAARSEDISSLKEAILSYAAVHSPGGELRPQINLSSSKSDTRGLNHPMLARLLCPIQYLDQFDENPEQTRLDLQEGRIPFTWEDYPAFMYAAGLYDRDDMEAGLLRHEFPLAVGRHVFEAPSAALRAPGSRPAPKPGQAKMHDFKVMTPGAIAYTILMSFWGICSQSDWRMEEGEVLKLPFFKSVVSLFIGPDANADWAKETIAFWTEQVLGSKPTTDRPSAPRTGQSSREILLAQRRAKQQNITLSNTQFTPLLGTSNTRSLDDTRDSTPQQHPPPPQSNSQAAGPSGSRGSGSTPADPAGGTDTSTSGSRSSASARSRNSVAPSSNTTNPTTPEPEGSDHESESSLLRRNREDSPMTGMESEREEEEVQGTRPKGKGRATDTRDAQPRDSPVATTRKRGRSGRRKK